MILGLAYAAYYNFEITYISYVIHHYMYYCTVVSPDYSIFNKHIFAFIPQVIWAIICEIE